MDRKALFTDRVEDYARARPGYPRGVIDLLISEPGLERSWVVGDIGAGTGLASELFLDHGNRVFAVEPNDAMRREAEARLGASPLFTSVPGSAEETTLATEGMDLVVVAQAFHWFDWRAARQEFLRILRPPARLVIMWNAREVHASSFMRGYESLVDRYRTHRESRNDRTPGVLPEFFEHGYAHRVLPNVQHFDFGGLEARLLSSSYAPKPDHPKHREMIENLRGLFERHQEGGGVAFPYRTEVFTGQLLPHATTRGA